MGVILGKKFSMALSATRLRPSFQGCLDSKQPLKIKIKCFALGQENKATFPDQENEDNFPLVGKDWGALLAVPLKDWEVPLHKIAQL